jgi:hypothetical protein
LADGYRLSLLSIIVYTETLAREALCPDEGRPRLLSLSCSFSEGTVADLQIYREGKHICGLDLDVTREREREREREKLL